MTKRELLGAKVRIYKQWLLLLTMEEFDEVFLNLPAGVSKQDEIDRTLDLLIKLRDKLLKIKE
jgi:hypothetical protein